MSGFISGIARRESQVIAYVAYALVRRRFFPSHEGTEINTNKPTHTRRTQPPATTNTQRLFGFKPMSALDFSLGTRVPGHAAPKEALFYARETHVAARCGIQWASHLAQEEKKTLRGDSRSVTKIADSVTASSLRAPALECLTKFPCNKPGERRQDSSERRKARCEQRRTQPHSPPAILGDTVARAAKRTQPHPRVTPEAHAARPSPPRVFPIPSYSSQILHPLHNRL